MEPDQIIKSAAEVGLLLDAMASRLTALTSAQGRTPFHMVGVRRGGLWVAQALAERLGYRGAMGELDIAFYRDDFSQLGLHPSVAPSNLPFDVDDAHVVLVDDILYTGRTVRAALNEIFDYGRPASVSLVVLVDRGGRELPMAPDVVGLTLDVAPEDEVKLRSSSDLSLINRRVR